MDYGARGAVGRVDLPRAPLDPDYFLFERIKSDL